MLRATVRSANNSFFAFFFRMNTSSKEITLSLLITYNIVYNIMLELM